MPRPDLGRRALAEGIAAFALVFAGCGAIVADSSYDGALGLVGISLVFGLVIMVMVYATGHLSGAHINPAVTVAFTLTRHFPTRDAAAYIGAQVAGATTGALLLLAVWPDQPAALGATIPTVAAGSALVYEVILTAFLMFVIMAVATDTRAVGAAAAIAIGGTVGLDALFGGPVTGASMNPARSFGPALVAGEWSDAWIYLVGPVVGAAVGRARLPGRPRRQTSHAMTGQSTDAVAVITDIHANLPALEASLACIEELGVKRVYCGGDLVGYGPHPNEVCALIEQRGIPTIYGNYDYAIARDEEDCGCAYVTQHDRELGRRSVDWTLAHTDQASKDFMRDLPFELHFQVGSTRIHLVHGSPRKVNEYLFEEKPARLYERLAAAEEAGVLVFGHTHKPWVHEYGGVLFVNCGSVGKPKTAIRAPPSPF